jgi:hypothetical protein
MKNKRIEIIQKQALSETKRIGVVLLGFVGGIGVARGMDWLADQVSEPYKSILQYGKVPALGVPGIILATATTPDEWFAKHLGYGLSAAATHEGIKLIPVFKDILQGIEQNMEKTYYTEGQQFGLGNLALAEVPVKSFELGEATPIEVDLPDLNGATVSLGYNGEQTKEVDAIQKLGYNGETTKDADSIQGLEDYNEEDGTENDNPDLSGIL